MNKTQERALFICLVKERQREIKREWVCVFECAAVPRMVLLVLSSSGWFYFEEHIVLTWHRWELGISFFVCLPFINQWKYR